MRKPITRQEAAALGKKATLVCKAVGAVKRSVDDERFGSVGSYPVNVLKMVYESEYESGEKEERSDIDAGNPDF